MNSMFETPKCEQCIIKIETIAFIDVHIKVKHTETDHERSEGRVKITTFAISKGNSNGKMTKSYDCSECAEIFVSAEDIKVHNQKKHIEKRKALTVDER